jgi:hypothetical protein
MNRLKKLGTLAVVICALGAVCVANASAEPKFTATKAGALNGLNANKQRWIFNGGEVVCGEANVGGNLPSEEFTDLHVTVTYSKCKVSGLIDVHVSPGTYSLTANGEMHFVETMTFTWTKTIFSAHCTLTIAPQSNKVVEYENAGSDPFVKFKLTNIVYTSTGGVCGSSGSFGILDGELRIGRTFGGSIIHDP